MEKVFLLKSQKNPVVDADHDAFCLPFPGKDMIGANMMGIGSFEKPHEIYFLADFASIPKYDFPDIDLTFPVLSKRMLQSLLKVGSFKYDIIPVTMIDDSYLENLFDKNGKLKSGVPFNNEYFALQIKEFTEAFDYTKSKFEKSTIFPDKVKFIHKLVLKKPKNGFPPVFKIKENMGLLFVSSASKKKLEDEGIKGCIFEEVEVC